MAAPRIPSIPSEGASDPSNLLFVGTHGFVTAVDRWKGHEVWKTSLPSTGYAIVSLLFEEGVLYAASAGHLFALDAAHGVILWTNHLKGMGNGHICLATIRTPGSMGAQPLQAAQAVGDDAAAAGGAAAAGVH